MALKRASSDVAPVLALGKSYAEAMILAAAHPSNQPLQGLSRMAERAFLEAQAAFDAQQARERQSQTVSTSSSSAATASSVLPVAVAAAAPAPRRRAYASSSSSSSFSSSSTTTSNYLDALAENDGDDVDDDDAGDDEIYEDDDDEIDDIDDANAPSAFGEGHIRKLAQMPPAANKCEI